MALRHRLIGKAARLVWRITRPRTIGVRAVLLDQHDRIALVRHTYTDGWYLPGGGVRKGESIEAALLRELTEEVAVIDARIERVVGVYHNRREAKDDHIVVFAVRTVSRASETLPNADRMEVAEAAGLRLTGSRTLPPPRQPAASPSTDRVRRAWVPGRRISRRRTPR